MLNELSNLIIKKPSIDDMQGVILPTCISNNKNNFKFI